MPSFKPRSVIDCNNDTISSVNGARSQITAVNSSKNKLLNKNVVNKGSYLNAERLAQINNINQKNINTPELKQNGYKESVQSFSNYQQITNHV